MASIDVKDEINAIAKRYADLVKEEMHEEPSRRNICDKIYYMLLFFII
ncbi:MAG TPA: hypothetical protein VFC73_02835 [Syntrophomonadaceae bacterium]|nr:hypothetical protein [Syntrophomonadaceae bacterium]